MCVPNVFQGTYWAQKQWTEKKKGILKITSDIQVKLDYSATLEFCQNGQDKNGWY